MLDRDPKGESWFPALLAAAPRASDVVDEDLLARPGRLLDACSATRTAGGLELRRCFEHEVMPSEGLLRWLIENPKALSWPRGRAGQFGSQTDARRRALRDGDEEVRKEALDELERLGPEGSARKWWAFEGITKVDCWLETDRLVLFVEGKRTETLSKFTAWFPARDQLTRDLDLVGEASPDKPGFVLLAVEEPVEEPSDDQLRAAAPHLGSRAADVLRRRYLGQVSWSRLCQATGVDCDSLPDEVPAR